MTTSTSTTSAPAAPKPVPIVIPVPAGTLGSGPRRRWLAAAVCAGCVAWATPGLAQTITNPTAIEFAASADHSVILPPDLGGGPAVVSYEARYFTVGGTTAICAVNLGKPTPTSGVISMPVSFACVPTHWTQRYEARVAAVGPTGAGVSGPSNPFAAVGSPQAPGAPAVSKP